MTSSIASGPHDRGEELRPAAGPSRGGGGRAPGREFLEGVLHRALAAPDPAETITGDDWKALLEVASVRREEPFGLEPVCVELVRAVLRSYFGARRGEADPFPEVSREIAATLFEDPVSHERLRTLWIRLIEDLK